MSAPRVSEQTRAGSASSKPTVLQRRDIPEAIRSLSTLAVPDYVDLFTALTSEATDRSPEQWARAVLEEAPLSGQNARVLWRLMGLRLGPRHSPDHVQGWKIAEHGDNWIRVETASWYMTAQAVCLVEEGQVSVSLSLRYENPIARLVWAFVAGPHQRAVPVMLRQAVRLIERGPATTS
jgi:hypothetical protein